MDRHPVDVVLLPARNELRYGSRIDTVELARLCVANACAISPSSGSAANALSQPRLTASARNAAVLRRPINRARAIYRSRPGIQGVVRHSDRASPYLSIPYSERLAEAGAQPSVGSVGDSYDNAFAETMIDLYNPAIIHRPVPWRYLKAVKYATL